MASIAHLSEDKNTESDKNHQKHNCSVTDIDTPHGAFFYGKPLIDAIRAFSRVSFNDIIGLIGNNTT